MTAKFNFKRLTEPFSARWPVIVSVPQDGGTVSEETFDAKFLLLTPEAQKAAEDSGPDGWITAFLLEVEGEPVSAELLAKLLGATYVRQALVNAYLSFARGIVAKN